jgi:hypothetical protein
VTAIYDIDQVDDRTFIAMEYVHGQPPRALWRALELTIQIADAFANVHGGRPRSGPSAAP